MEPLPVDLAAIMDEITLRSQVPQRVLAARAGLSQQTVSAYGRGTRQPTLKTLQQVAAAGGLQLRLSVEPLGSDVVRDIKRLRDRPREQWMDDLGLLWEGARDLVRGVPHRFEGQAAARVQGVPVPCPVVEVAVRDDDEVLTAVVDNARTCFAGLETPGTDWAPMPDNLEAVRDRMDGQVLHWLPYRIPEVRMRLVETVPTPLVIALGGDEVAVAPIAEVVVEDPRVARVLRATMEHDEGGGDA